MGPEWCDQRTQLWDALGLKEEVATLLSQVLEVEFLDGRLYISEDCEEINDLVSMIQTTFLSAWKFTKFTESRWLTVGTSARSLVCGFLLGLQDLINEISSDPQHSLFYLNGFKRMVADRRQFMVMAAIVSWVPESVLAELLEDHRVALVYDDLWMALATNMKWLVTLPKHLWVTLASITEVDSSSLQSGCIQGARKAFHFFWRRVLQPASEYP
eukprot:1708100-Lingulodinium_polyedra.AAC.1